jgi:cytochrome c-type biogenesis protein CcmH/NrfG
MRLGDIALRRSNLKLAKAHYVKALKIWPGDPDADLGLAKILMSMQKPKEAEPYLQRAVKLDPYNLASRYRLATLDRKLGRMADSRRELAEFEKLNKMKSQLQKIYEQMHLVPKGQQPPSGMGN